MNAGVGRPLQGDRLFGSEMHEDPYPVYRDRVATEGVELQGKAIRKGDMVLVVLAAANRDPERFPDPDRLDVLRRDNHHVAFGHGHHFCVGAQLARLEARSAFTALLSRLRVLELETTDLSHRPNFNLRCFQNLPLRVGP